MIANIDAPKNKDLAEECKIIGSIIFLKSVSKVNAINI